MKRLCLILAYLFLFTQTVSAMPLLIGQKVVYRGTITGLRISAVNGTALVDNLSGTLALANSPLLHTGTLTQENTRISAVATFAFIDTNDATFATNLAAHLGKYLVIKDSAGKKAYAWIKAAGTGETLGADLLSGFDFTSGWSTKPDTTINDSNTFTSGGGLSAYVYKTILTTKALYKGSISATSSNGKVIYIRDGNLSVNYIPNNGSGVYFTALDTFFIIYHACAVGEYCDVSSQSVYQVLSPSSSGATLSSTKNGTAMDNWESIETGFNYNDSSGYTYYIYGRDITDIADGNHQIEIYDSSNRMLKGVLKEAGTSETLGADLLSGFDFTSGCGVIGAGSIIDSNSFSTTSVGGVSKSVLSSLRLYKRAYEKSTTAASSMFRISDSGGFMSPNDTDLETGSKYSTTIPNYLFCYARNSSAGTTDVTTFTVQQVLAPSSSGATITTLKNGDVYNWSYKNSSFSFNSASYYVIIKLIR